MIASKGAHLVSITRVRKTFAPDLLAELREALLFVLANDHVECALIGNRTISRQMISRR